VRSLSHGCGFVRRKQQQLQRYPLMTEDQESDKRRTKVAT
jgi:hypothetical protein